MTEKLEDHTEEISESRNTEDMRNVSHRNIAHTENPDIGKSTDTYKSVNNESEDIRPGSDNRQNYDDIGQSPNTDDPVDNSDDTPDTFARGYVEKLRDENAKYRQSAQRSDDLAQRLHEALVAATCRLQDPSDLTYNEDHLDDPEALQAAIEDLLARKPHLASRRPLGDIGQGVTNGNTGDVDLAALLRSRA